MRLSKILPVIGLALFVFIIARAGPLKIVQVLSDVDLYYLLLSIGMVALVTVLKGFKWKMVIGMHGCDYRFSQSVRVWLIGALTGIITPGRAGDLIRALYLNKHCKGLGRCISTVVIDRAIELAVALVFASFGIVLFSAWFGESALLYVVITFVVIGFALLGLMFRKSFMRRALRPIFRVFVPARHEDRMRASFHEFYGSMGDIRKRRGSLAAVSIFSVGIWLIQILEVQIFALALGIQIDYLYMLAVLSIVVIIELIPVSVSGIGTRDAFLVFSLGLIGVSPELAIALSIVYLVLGYWINAAMGLFFWLKDPVRLRT